MERWSNQTDSGEFAEGETADRWIKRSRTWPGIADAAGEQWGAWLETKLGSVARITAQATISIACNSHNENGPGGMEPPEPSPTGADAGAEGKIEPTPIPSTDDFERTGNGHQ